MAILDNLIEKKDITLYLLFRKRILEEERKKGMKRYPAKDREKQNKLLQVRKAELGRLLQLLSKNKLKEDCKKMWRHFEGKKEKGEK